jgi:predicted O-methyltransferase YrrM
LPSVIGRASLSRIVTRTVADLPPDFRSASDAAWRHVSETPGYLAEREARFLMLAAAGAPASGAIVEIGSFKGRSTVGLASIAQRYGLGRVVAVDPHTSPSDTDPDLGGQSSSYDDFLANLRRVGVASMVDSRRMFSRELARVWNEPIRLLWIDGDHTYAAVQEDLALFCPYLARGGILAMHDVLGTWEGPLSVFVERVLESDDFGPAGFCGSIGWAQYLPGEGGVRRFRRSRRRLAWAARHLIPVARAGRVASGVNKWRYKLWRALAPHHAVDPARWVAQVRLPRSTGP